MIYLSQRDPLWSTTKLGSSSLTLGRWGCTTTCISMMTGKFGNVISPHTLALYREYYTPQGLVIWGALKLPGIKFLRRIRSYSYNEILNDVKNPKRAVLLEVNGKTHWILADHKMLFRNDFVCADPWTGKACAAIGDHYNITGSAHFEKV